MSPVSSWSTEITDSWLISSPGFKELVPGGGRCVELGAGVSALPSLVAAHLNCFAEVVPTICRSIGRAASYKDTL